MKYTTFSVLLLALSISSGCASFNTDWKKSLPWSPQSRLKNSKFETPSHMVAIWTADVLTQPGKPPTRGFGGRLYFYNQKNQAVPVEGQLVVYGYDDTYRNGDKPGEPQRKFAFTPEQFTKHYSESDLGASYSVWLPWDAVGGEQRSISLVPVFTATSGKVVMGPQALNLLPGTIAHKAKAEGPKSLLAVQQAAPTSANATGAVQQASHEQSAGTSNGVSGQTRQRMRTSTITLTPNLSRHVAAAPNQPIQTPPAAAPVTFGATPRVPTLPTTAPVGQALPQGAPQQGPNLDPPQAHFGPTRFPAREALSARPNPAAPWTPPYPLTPQSALQAASSR